MLWLRLLTLLATAHSMSEQESGEVTFKVIKDYNLKYNESLKCFLIVIYLCVFLVSVFCTGLENILLFSIYTDVRYFGDISA